MNDTMQLEKTPYQLGLPPMELAETSDQESSGTKRCLIHPLFQKFVTIVSIILCMAGAYIILTSLLQSFDFSSTEIVIVNEDTPNVTLQQGKIEIVVLYINKTQTNSTRIKRDIDEMIPGDPTDIADSIENTTDDVFINTFDKLDDEKINQARELIKQHRGKCDDSNKEEICKNLVTTIRALAETEHDKQNSLPPNDINAIVDENISIEKDTTLTTKIETPETMADLQQLKNTPNILNTIIDDSERFVEKDTTLTIKRETSGIIADSEHLKPTLNSPFEARDSYGYVPDPIAPLIVHSPMSSPVLPYPPVPGSPPIADSCLLAKLLRQQYPHAFVDVPSPQPHYDNHLNPYSRFAQPPHPVRIGDTPNIMHHQDAEIMINFLTPKSIERASNLTTREANCDPGSVPCSDGEGCILEEQWCDGRVDCSDISDESGCGCKSRVDKSRLCDGYFDCPFGEDEMGCYGCSESFFSCVDLDVNSQSTCFTKEQRCNHVADCPNKRDEMDCTMLAPTLHKNALFAVSNTEGFLHRNFRGDWYVVCENPYMWAHDACRKETGLIIRPPFIQTIPIDPMLRVNYLNMGEGGMFQVSNTCFNNSAIYVTCPDLLCGTRIMPATQVLIENPEVENHLFGRNKRFLLKYPYTDLFYRTKRHIANIADSKQSVLDSLHSEKGSKGLRYKRTQSRVVGGRPSEGAAWPWMVAMYRNGMFHCGGVVLTQKWTMSAAHCMHKFWNFYFEIRVGMLRRFSFSPQESNHKVTHVIVNHKYNKEDMKNDISLLKVTPAIQFSRWIRPICLPGPETAGLEWIWGPPEGTMCTAVGWGATVEHGPDPDHLREVEVPVWSHCKHREDREGREICAGVNEGGRDACQGDSGGPLLCKNPRNPQQWYMAGIVSHGDGCGRKDEPGVYTRVSLFVKWIRHHIFSKSLPSIRPKQECPGFQCITGIAKCLPAKRACDKIVDCLGGEDEINCNSIRSPFQSNVLMSTQNIEDIKNEMGGKFETREAEIKSDDMDNFSSEVTSRTNSQISKSAEDNKTSESHETVEPFTIENMKTSRGDMDDSISILLPKSSLESRDSTIEKNTSIPKEADINENWDDLPKTSISPEIISTVTTSIEENTKTTNAANTNNSEIQEVTESTTTEQVPEKIHSSQEFTVTEVVAEPESKNLMIDLIEPPSSSDTKINDENNTLPPLDIQHNSAESKSLPVLESNNIIKDSMKSELTLAKLKRQPRIPVEFECRHILQSIPYHQRCDRKADCEDGTDEFSCTCYDYISRFDQHLICNGVLDCADGQDEMDCYTCPDDSFLCKRSQQCLPTKYVCDERPHCPMGEDELECYALTDGKSISGDFNGAPKLSLQGFITKRHYKDWHVVCEENLTTQQHETAANHICRYLGFSSANSFLVKHINIKDENILRSESNEDTRNRRNIDSDVPVHFAYRKSEDTARHIVINEPQFLKEQCVPNVTKTCMSLYVYCDHALFTDNFGSPNEILYNREADVKTHMWPWVAKVFVDGDYRCSGVLVDLSWTLVSHSCLWDALLSHHLVTVVLGSPNTLSSSNGMYEQVFKVDAKIELYHTKAVLLHLKEPAHYSNMVKPMVVSSNFQDEKPSVCLAIGQDEKNATIGMFLEETYENCDPHNRCFIRPQHENICMPGIKSRQHWAGVISCHAERGWYPAATFVDSRGECGVGDRIVGSEIGNFKNEIKHFIDKKTDSSEVNFALQCDGVRCGRGRCVKLTNVCDGVADCEDRNDELEGACQKKSEICAKEPYLAGCTCPSGQLKCHNGRCVGKELFNNSRDDCGDSTDEPSIMSCAHYLSKVKPSRVCDGILHCKDRSDEDPTFCKCFAKKGFRCNQVPSDVDLCVPYDVVCDGINDCPSGEDEKKCLGLGGTATGIGQVMIQSHGVWYSKCYKSQNYTKMELEAICKELGFISGHAKLLEVPPNFKQTYYTVDHFNDVMLNNNTKITLRNSDEPLAKAIVKETNDNCIPLYIECL